jgi:hypothetical protein
MVTDESRRNKAVQGKPYATAMRDKPLEMPQKPQ